jgi:adenylate kinase
MRLILLGAPGSGKGTISKMLVEKYSIVQISTGDILRGAVAAGTPIGKEAEAYMKRGDLVPDSVIMGIMEERLGEADCASGFILDGFPRTIPQAESLGVMLKSSRSGWTRYAISTCPRMSLSSGSRASHLFQSVVPGDFQSGRKAPKKEGVCDRCGFRARSAR